MVRFHAPEPYSRLEQPGSSLGSYPKGRVGSNPASATISLIVFNRAIGDHSGRVKRLPHESHTLITPGSTPVFRSHFMSLIGVTPVNLDFFRFCNTLRCPLCSAQLDGNINDKKADIYCAANNAEYKLHWLPGEQTPIYEYLSFWYTQYQYEVVINRRGPNTFETVIDRINLDLHRFYRESSRKRVFSMSGDRVMFFRTRMEEETFLSKLKLYNVFS